MLATLPVPAGTSWTQLYQAGGTYPAPVEVSLCNTDALSTKVGLAVTLTGTAPVAGASSPASTSCAVYEFARVIGPAGVSGNGPLTRNLNLKPGQYVWVQADRVGVSAAIDGYVE